MKKLKELPESLQKQVLSRLGLGILALFLFVLLLYMTRELFSVLPCIALACFCAINAYLLYRRAVLGDYIIIQGVCGAVEVTPIRKRTKAIQIQAEGHIVRVVVKHRLRKIQSGMYVNLYVAKNATFEEKDGTLILHNYLALELEGGTDNAYRGADTNAGEPEELDS